MSDETARAESAASEGSTPTVSIPPSRRKPSRMPETDDIAPDLDWGDTRAIAWESARQASLRATPEGTYEDHALIADIVAERLIDQVPGLAFFGSNKIRPMENNDQSIVVSLNGKLLRVYRGRDEKGESTSGEELYGLNWHEFDILVGRLLTLCDAIFTDPRQRKAFKDMVRQHVKEWVTSCIVNAAADAGLSMNLTAPFTGGIPDEELFGVEGQPTI